MCMSTPKADNTAQAQAQREADEARQREAEKQANLSYGRELINRRFAGQSYVGGGQTENPEWTAWNQRRQEFGSFGDMPGWTVSFNEPEPTRYIRNDGQWVQDGQSFDDPSFYEQRRRDYISVYQPQIDRQRDDAQRTMLFDLADRGLINSSEAGRQQGRLAEAYQNEIGNLAARAQGEVNTLRSNVDKAKADLINQLQTTGDVDGAAAAALGRSQTLAATPVTSETLGDLFSGLLTSGASIYAGRQNYGTTQAVNGALQPSSARSSSATSLRN